MYCLFLRLEISPSIQPRFGDTKGWPSLFSSEESSDLFYWVKLPFNQSNRRRHREVWIERKSKHSTLSCDYFNCHNCSPRAVHLWNRKKKKKFYFQLLSKLLFKTTVSLSGVMRRVGILRFPKVIEPGSSSSEESLSTAAPVHLKIIDFPMMPR